MLRVGLRLRRMQVFVIWLEAEGAALINTRRWFSVVRQRHG
jgi:hypothetical protein